MKAKEKTNGQFRSTATMRRPEPGVDRTLCPSLVSRWVPATRDPDKLVGVMPEDLKSFFGWFRSGGGSGSDLRRPEEDDTGESREDADSSRASQALTFDLTGQHHGHDRIQRAQDADDR